METNLEYQINCLAMAIVNYTNEINNVNIDVRQSNNDKCFDFAVEKIKEYLNQPLIIKCDISDIDKEELKRQLKIFGGVISIPNERWSVEL